MVIFLVENDSESFVAVRQHLEQAGYAVRSFLSGAGAIRQAEETLPVLIMIGLARDWPGLELCRQFRRNPFLAKTPIVCLLQKGGEAGRVAALGAGADDCMAAPFNPREVLARLRAVLRRLEQPADWKPRLAITVMRLGEFEIDCSTMRISVNGNEITTTTLEFRLMEYLARHRGRVFTRDQLLDAVWGDARFVTPRSVDACVRRIRRKFEPVCSAQHFLKTIRGVGYRFDV